MAGKCKKRTVKFGKWVGRQLRPAGIKLIAVLVGAAQNSTMSGKEKRDFVIGAAKQLLGEVKENAIRAGVEFAVGALKADPDPDALSDLGDAEDADLVEDTP